jgi:hypothetical protein
MCRVQGPRVKFWLRKTVACKSHTSAEVSSTSVDGSTSTPVREGKHVITVSGSDLL